MSRETQKKFIAALRAMVARDGYRTMDGVQYEVLDDPDFVNTGYLRVQRVGSFANILVLKYEFHSNYQTLTLKEWGGRKGDKLLPDNLDLAMGALRDIVREQADKDRR